jgi:photosynthetic reaction center cytochrome c subunit
MRTIVSTLALLAMAALVIVAQDKGKAPGGPAKAPPKNLRILTADNYKQNMQAFVAALGVAEKGGCNFCHEADRSLDTKKEKVMAFKMLQMVNDINKNTFAGEAKVSCYTCHRGQEHPPAAAPAQ